jgi:hypothetical protein
MAVRLRIFATIAFLAIGLTSQTSIAQTTSTGALLDRQVEDVEISEANAHLALSQLQLAMGYQSALRWRKGGNNGPQIHLRFKNATLRRLLDAIVAQDNRYEWSLRNEVISVTPKSNRDWFLSGLLDTEIKAFSTGTATDTFGLRAIIVDLPEVEDKLNGANVRPEVSAYTNADTAKLGHKFSLTMHNTTLKGILDEIVKAKTSEVRYWIVNRFGEHDEHFLVNFTTFEGPPLQITAR